MKNIKEDNLVDVLWRAEMVRRHNEDPGPPSGYSQIGVAIVLVYLGYCVIKFNLSS
jgi:hypothetical protein